MSWDVIIMSKGDHVYESFEKMPKTFIPEPMGPRDLVKEQISSIFSSIAWDNPEFGNFQGTHFAMEVAIGAEEVVDSVHIRVLGAGEPVPLIVSLVNKYSWIAYDCSTGDAIDPASPENTSWNNYQGWRNK